MLIAVIVAALLLALAPQLWVRSVLRRHAVDRPDFPGTGGEFARHVLDRLGLHEVRVEQTDIGDHYDAKDGVVRLIPDHFNGRSLTAVVVAAHEVGHAMQDASAYPALATRTRLAEIAIKLQKAGAVVMLAAPLLFAVVRSPVALLLQAGLAVVVLGLSVLLHLVTLPVELDASFRRALPVLETGRYLESRDLPAARSILRAAALTYVASAAMSLLNVAAWIRILR